MMFPFQCRFTSGISIRHSWQHRRVPPEFSGTFNVWGVRSSPQLSNKNMSFSGKGWICIGWKHIDDDRDRKFEGTRPLVNYNIDMDWETKPWWLFIYCIYIYILSLMHVQYYTYMFFEGLNDLCIWQRDWIPAKWPDSLPGMMPW